MNMGLRSVLLIAAGLTLATGCTSDETSPSALVSVSPGASASEAAPSASAEAALDADDVFDASVSGYEFVEVPNRLENQARRQFYASSGLARRDARIDLQSITKDDTGLGVVMVVALSPEMAALPGTTAEGFASGIAEEADTQPDEVNLGATTGYVINSGGQVFVAWQNENLLVALIGEDRGDSVAAAQAVAEATAA
jgi:hypothetical protein